MRPKSAAELEARWQSRPWYHKPTGTPGEPRHPQGDLNLRLRRALSWLGRAEKEYAVEDFDAAFIFYWIAFNAMYGQLGTSSVDEAYEKDRRRDYFDRVVAFADAESVIYAAIWSVLRDDVERMLANRYVYEPYWRHRNNPAEDRDWEQRFDRARERATEAIRRTRTKDVLRELFFRLNTLRNQSASRRCDLEQFREPKPSTARRENHGVAGVALHRRDDRASGRLRRSTLSGGPRERSAIWGYRNWVMSATSLRVPSTP